ncbi:DUF2310 family Zn-ribbon-containing protein [Dyella psychrodurans]|uniref:Uncharacterized protein n=1 Tax=Dyella psychrodurans TaxID=1927960 RepID=A0A370X0Q8_9GAMM|nr:DUF2310 family Zn-ribbon-containing protein [Dyella psychrodurans]RDS81989.1 hypothetical protein DWU99_16385 [Dyella psychrodurans]
MNNNDQYRKLMPPEPISPEEQCTCAEIQAIYLAFDLTENPIHCDICRGAVAPERIELTPSQVDAVADWTTTFGSIYKLWLQSGSYEAWAYEQLVEAGSAVNLGGMAVAGALSTGRSCGYLWFWNERRPDCCPRCASALDTLPNAFLRCPICKVYV